MASTYNNLKFELMATGDQPGIWGVTTDENLDAIMQAIGGLASVVFSTDANKTLTYLNSNTPQDFRAVALYLTSTVSLTATRNLVLPAVQKLYVIKNSTTGGQSITVKIGSSTGITIANGYTQLVYADGSDVVVTSPNDAYLVVRQGTGVNPNSSSNIANPVTIQWFQGTNGVTPVSGAEAYPTTHVGLIPEGYGGIVAGSQDGTSAGGNQRGAYAVDLQTARSAANQVVYGDWSVIGGGINNRNEGFYSVISGGQANGIYDASVTNLTNSFIGGGNGNIVDAYYGTIVGGNANSISSTSINSFYSFIGSGLQNTISGSSSGYSFIGSGTLNTITGQYSFIGGGTSNSVSHSSAVIMGGASAASRTTASRNFAAGSFSTTKGTAQDGKYVLRAATSDGTATRLTTGGTAASALNVVNLPDNSSYYIKGRVIARNTSTGDTKAWTFEGAIKRGSGAATTALISAISPSSVAADSGASAWSLAVTADTTNGGLAVTGTGAAATSIRWVATVDTVEVVNG